MDRSLIEKVIQAKRPVVVVGAGCLESSESLRTFVERVKIPVVCSLPAVGIIPTDHWLFFGMIGHTGDPGANAIVSCSDLILALGTRLDVRQTGTEVKSFPPTVLVNNDEQQLYNARVECDKVLETCEQALSSLTITFNSNQERLEWVEKCSEISYLNPIPDSITAQTIKEIDASVEGPCIFVTGVGSHQQHAARHLTLDYPSRQLLTSSGHGTMGAGLPMAIGASLATKKKVVLIDGDGSFQLSLSELGMFLSHFPDLDIDIHIIDNGSGGIVSQFCRLQGYNPVETTWISPDWGKIAEAYGVKIKVHKISEIGVWPILEGGHLMSDMSREK